MAVSSTPTPTPDLTTTAVQVAIQGFPQFLGVIVGGAVTLIATVITTNRQAKQASIAREEERKAKRDELQRQVLFELQEAVRTFTEAVGRELRETRDNGEASEEAEALTLRPEPDKKFGPIVFDQKSFEPR